MAGDISRILVPVDGSQGACRAAAFAAQLALRLDAQLLLLHVHPMAVGEVLGMRSVEDEELAQIKQGVAKEAFETARAAIGDDDFPVEEIVRLGDPALEIVTQASARDVGLIVMGTRGRSPMKELILGSVSDKVVRHAPCAVTIVR